MTDQYGKPLNTTGNAGKLSWNAKLPHVALEVLTTPWMAYFLLLGLALLLAAGVLWWLSRGDWTYPTQVRARGLANQELTGPLTVGQTFMASQAGLQAIDVRMRPGSRPVTLHLRQELEAQEDLRQVQVTPSEPGAETWLRFSFEPIPDSRMQNYYFFIEAPTSTGGEAPRIYYGLPGDYLDGTLHVNGAPQEGQMVFRLVYNRPPMAWELLLSLANALPTGLLAVLVWVVPGWGLLVILGRYSSVLASHWAEGLALATGFSLALYPLLMLWTDVVGLHLGPLYVWLPLIAGLIVLFWHYRLWRPAAGRIFAAIKAGPERANFWPDITLICLLFIAALGRYLAARGLSMPLWDDSVQHTVMVRRLLETGGLFQSWEPYTPYSSLSTHFGFHANSAVLAWTTGLDAPQAVIWTGQILNWLAIFALYPLAYRIKGAWAGVITVLIAGLFSQFPMYYTNWGRYPQLSGQVLLPIAAWWLWMVLADRRMSARKLAIYVFGAAFLMAGMSLAYYRMAFHYLAFAVAVLLTGFNSPRLVFNRWSWLTLAGTAVLAGLLILPRISSITSNEREIVVALASATPLQGSPQEAWQNLQAMRMGWPMLQGVVMLLGTLAGIWLGGTAALPVVWMWLLVIMPALRLLPLPGVQIIQEFTIDTSLYMPVALIWGAIGGYIANRFFGFSWWKPALLSVLIVVAAILSLPRLIGLIDRDYDLSTQPDLQAAEWIKEHLPGDSFFLINGIVYTDGTSAVGGDAGWWLPTLTGRGVTIPPQYALGAEKPVLPGYSETVNHLVRRLFQILPDTAEARQLLCSYPYPISHVYLGQRRGLVARELSPPPPRSMLPAESLLQDSAFRLIYHRDRVMIFEFDRSVCAPAPLR